MPLPTSSAAPAAPAVRSTPWTTALVTALLVTSSVAGQAADGAGSGLAASYFSNESLAGVASLHRTDPVVDFSWASAAPAPDLPVDRFSVRWTGELEAPVDGPLTVV